MEVDPARELEPEVVDSNPEAVELDLDFGPDRLDRKALLVESPAFPLMTSMNPLALI